MLTLIDQPGRFSRRLGEQVPDATYAQSIEVPVRPVGRAVDILCWLAVPVLLWVAYVYARSL